MILPNFSKLSDFRSFSSEKQRIGHWSFPCAAVAQGTVLSYSQSHTLRRSAVRHYDSPCPPRIHASNLLLSLSQKRAALPCHAASSATSLPCNRDKKGREAARRKKQEWQKESGIGRPARLVVESWKGGSHGYTARFREILGPTASPRARPSLLPRHPGQRPQRQR